MSFGNRYGSMIVVLAFGAACLCSASGCSSDGETSPSSPSGTSGSPGTPGSSGSSAGAKNFTLKGKAK